MHKLFMRFGLLAALSVLGFGILTTHANARPGNAAAVSSANFAPSPRPDLAGRLYIDVNNAVYLVDPDGYLRWVPDPQTYGNLYGNHWNVTSEAFITNNIALGTPLTSGAALVQRGSTGYISIVTNGVVRHIVDPQTFTQYGFDWGAVVTIPPVVYDLLTTGPPWT